MTICAKCLVRSADWSQCRMSSESHEARSLSCATCRWTGDVCLDHIMQRHIRLTQQACTGSTSSACCRLPTRGNDTTVCQLQVGVAFRRITWAAFPPQPVCAAQCVVQVVQWQVELLCRRRPDPLLRNERASVPGWQHQFQLPGIWLKIGTYSPEGLPPDKLLRLSSNRSGRLSAFRVAFIRQWRAGGYRLQAVELRVRHASILHETQGFNRRCRLLRQTGA